jgi:undecaprenyl-diphosphatase
MESHWWIAAACCFVAFAALGALVSTRSPTRIDVEANALRGSGIEAAVFFTLLGRWYVVVILLLLAAVATAAARWSIWPLAALGVAQFLSQAGSFASKRSFRRPRPDYWLLHQELDLSYPSGHAVTAIVFYVGLVLLIAGASALPQQSATILIAVLAICAIGIPWSRIALGAHYLTDVVGGLLFGAGWVSVAIALAYHVGAVGSHG